MAMDDILRWADDVRWETDNGRLAAIIDIFFTCRLKSIETTEFSWLSSIEGTRHRVA